MSTVRMVDVCGFLGSGGAASRASTPPSRRRVPAKTAFTPQQRFPFLTPGLARFAAGIKLGGPAKHASQKRGLGCLAAGHERFAAGIKFR